MSNIYDFDSALKNYQNRAADAIGQSEHTPDDAQRAFDMSKATGVPAGFIAENSEEFEKDLQGKLAGAILQQNAPLTAFTNSHPLHPSLIKDDVTNLDDVSKSFDKMRWDPYGEGFKSYAQAHDAFIQGDQSAFDAAAQRLAKGALRGRTQFPERPIPLDYATWGNLAQAIEKQYPHPPQDIRQLPQWLRDNPDAIGTIIGMVAPPVSEGGFFSPRTKVQDFIDLANEIQARQRAEAMGEAVREGARAAEARQPPQLALPSPESVQAAADSIGAELQKVKPWAEAGVEPLPGISTLTDFAKEHQSSIEADGIKGAVDASATSALKERSPEKFEEFLEHHPTATISIDPRVILANPDAFPWLAPPTGPGMVQVPASQFLANFDKENWDKVKDDIALNGLTQNVINELKEAPAVPIQGDNVEQLRNALGLTAWHATTADFRQFSLDYMGTGEGAQSFGPGHYFAESQGTAEDYFKKFSEQMMSDEERQAARILEANDGDKEAALASINGQIEELKGKVGGSKLRAQVLDRVRQVIESGRELPKANLLKVTLDVDPKFMLDYDKPLAQQSPEVQNIISKMIPSIGKGGNVASVKGIDKILEELRDQGASVQARMDEQAQAKRWRQLPAKLSAAGLHGIRYLDQGSRAARNTVEFERDLAYWERRLERIQDEATPEQAERVTAEAKKHIAELEQLIKEAKEAPQTSNFVIFDDNRIKITHKNGEPVSEALRRKVLERTKSGRPLRTQKMRMGPSLSRDILEAGFDRTLPENQPEPFEGGKAMGISQKMYQSLLDKIEAMTSGDAKWRQRRAEAQVKLERSNQWKEERAKLEPEVRAEIESLGVVGAWQRIKKVKLDSAHVTPAQRADIPELVSPNGMNPDLLAGEFGFDTGQDLIQAMRELAGEAKRGPGDIVDRLVDQRLDLKLREKLGKTPLDRLEEEIDHTLSLTTMEMLHEKIVAMAAQIGTQIPLSKYAMNWMAKQALEAKNFKGLSAMKLMRDVVVEAKRVQRALEAGKMQEAFVSLQNQYSLTMQARIMREVEKEAKGFDRAAKSLREREGMPSLPNEYNGFLQQILMKSGQKVRRTAEDLGHMMDLGHKNQGWAKDLDAFVDWLTEGEGWDAPVADFLRTGPPKSLDKMTIGEARALFDSVRTLIKRGRDSQKIIQAGKEIDFNDLRNEAVDMVMAVGPFKPAPARAGPARKVFNVVKTFGWANVTTEMFFNRLGEFKPGNIMLRWLIDPLIDGFYYRDELIKKFAQQYKDLGVIPNPKGTIKNDLFRDPDAFNLHGLTIYPKLNRQDAYAVLANIGNNSNLDKLAAGYGILDAMGKPDRQKVMDWVGREIREGRLSHDDLKWMQGYGRITRQIKDLADANALAESDVPAENIPLEGFDIEGKHYDGWYHRLTPHEFWEGKPQAADSVNLEGPGYTRAATPRRYEKARTDAKYPLSFDFDRVVKASINEQLHDIALRGPIREFAKLLRDEKFRTAVRNHVSKEVLDNTEEWLKGISNSAVRDNAVDGALMAGARMFRRNVIGNALNFNPGTVVKHFSTAWIRSGVVVGPIDYFNAVAQLYTPIRFFMNKNINHIMSESREIPTRGDFWEHTMTGSISASHGEWNLTRLWNKAGRSPVAFSDMLSVMPTFYAAYTRAFKETGDREMARIAGDRAVVEAHGSMNPARRSRVMAGGNSLWQQYTSFMNFFSTIFQAYYKSLARFNIGAKAGKEGDWEKAFDQFYRGLFPFIITAATIAIVEHEVKKWLGQNKEGKAGTVQHIGQALEPFAAPIPLLNQIVQAMEQGTDTAFGIAAEGWNEVMRGIQEAAKAIEEKRRVGRISNKVKSGLIRKGIGGAGNVAGGFPGAAPARMIDNARRLANEEVHPKPGWEYFWFLLGGKERK